MTEHTKEPMSFEVAMDFARDPYYHDTLRCPADSKEELRKALTILADKIDLLDMRVAELKNALAGIDDPEAFMLDVRELATEPNMARVISLNESIMEHLKGGDA